MVCVRRKRNYGGGFTLSIVDPAAQIGFLNKLAGSFDPGCCVAAGPREEPSILFVKCGELA